jgi:uncharacterized protein (TIGR03083 family)
MPEGAFELGARVQLDAVEGLIVDAFASQRHRMLETARSLDAAEWTEPTRCSAWNAHELLIHAIGTTSACRSTLTGEQEAFGGSFDPNSSPNQFVDQRSAQPVDRSLTDFESAITATLDVIDARRADIAPLQVLAVWGEPVDWRLLVAHMFFDGWVHERDLLLPLGRVPVLDAAEARLGTAYGLHTAGIVAGLFSIPLDTTLQLGGAGAGTFRIQVDHRDVQITVGLPDARTGRCDGDAVTVTDSMMGREPPLPTVLRAEPDVLDALSGVGTFLRA